MSFLNGIYKFLWKEVEKGDNKRMSGQSLPDKITAIVDVPYADDGKKEHLLDFYYPEETSSKLPTIIDIHGGGLMYAYKELNKNYCYRLAERGFTVIGVNYSLAPENPYPACLKDVSAALTYIGDNIASYPCNPDEVFITGDSAGALLAAQAVLLSSSEELRKAFGVKPINLDFKAAGYTSGMFEMSSGLAKFLAPGIFGKGGAKKSAFSKYLPFADVMDKGKMPPCYLVTSKEDMIRPATLHFKALLDEKGIENKLSDYPKGVGHKLEHVFSVLYPDYDESREVIAEMTEFFIAHI